MSLYARCILPTDHWTLLTVPQLYGRKRPAKRLYEIEVHWATEQERLCRDCEVESFQSLSKHRNNLTCWSNYFSSNV